MLHEDRPRQLDFVAGLSFTALTLWMLLLQPIHVTPPSQWIDPHRLWLLIAAYGLFISAWRTHGYLYSMVSCTLFILSYTQSTDNHLQAFWQNTQTIFIAILGVNFLVWPNRDARNGRVLLWLFGGLGLVVFSTLLWIGAERNYELSQDAMADALLASDQRIRICSFIMIVLGGFGMLLTSKVTRATCLWFAISVAAPIAGFGIAQLWQSIAIEHLMSGVNLHHLGSDLLTWAARPDALASCQSWCWTSPWLVLALMILGLGRALGRGFRQRKQGNSATAWLMLPAAVLLLPMLLPVASDNQSPIALNWLSIALSVFAIADLLLLVFEQLVLPTPQTGPSNISHL